MESVVRATVQDDHLLLVTENGDEGEQEQTEYEMKLIGDDRATIRVLEIPLEAWSFERADGPVSPAVATDWDPQATYPRERHAASDPEMRKIYDADQAARQDMGRISREQWVDIGREDAQRRERTRELLAQGRLQTGEDFIRAAFVFQHGDSPDDYLLAHTLALIAAGKGDEKGTWIGAASLDRYLHSIGKPQIYGTQFKQDSDGVATQQPYDRNLIADSLRRLLGVPSLDVQQEQLRWWTEQFRPAEEQAESP